jgi:hypothetical protein
MLSKRLFSLFAIALLCAGLVANSCGQVLAWSNGGYSTDPAHPIYGTHDWIAQHALDWLPAQEKQYIQNNVVAYLYGTELPDNNVAPDHIGDTTKHHIYYRFNGTLQDDAAAVRASAEYQKALNFLNQKDYANAAKTAGIMSHYIVDVAVFAHIMGSSTDWGAETGNNHSNFEEYVNRRTSSYTDEFNHYLSFDGNLSVISAYNAAKNLAYDTTFDHGGSLTCVWMNNNYNVSNPTYWNRAGESLNLAVNYLTDILHSLYLASTPTPTIAPTSTPTATPNQTSTPAPTSPPTSVPTVAPTPLPSLKPSPTFPPPTTPTPTSTPEPTITSTPPVPEFPSGFAFATLILACSVLAVYMTKKSLMKKHN